MTRQHGPSPGLKALLAMGLLGVGALLRDWRLLLGHAPGEGGAGSPSQQHLSALETEVSELRRQFLDLREDMHKEVQTSSDQLREEFKIVSDAVAGRPPAEIRSSAAATRTSKDAFQDLHVTDTSLAQEPLAITADNLKATAKQIVHRLDTCCMKLGIGARFDSLAWLEAVAVAAAAVTAQIDVLVESGVASGFSSEVWARFFQGTGVKIYAIDKDCEGRNDTPAAAKRLAAFPNVQYIAGDSFLEVPRIIQQHSGQRIGVHVDGPKFHEGSDLALKAIELSTDVKFAAQHDTTEYALIDDDLFKSHNAWTRGVLRTWEAGWRREFSYLDHCDTSSNCGWGMLILAGQSDIPLSDNDGMIHEAIKRR